MLLNHLLHLKESINYMYIVYNKQIFLFLRNHEEPALITGLSGKQVAKICCGSSYSVALTSNGEVYSWGKGNFGRLGHGSSEDQTTPMLLKFFKGHRIVDVACGSGDAQTLAVTDSG